MTRKSHQTDAGDIELAVATRTVCYIIFKAREYDVKVEETDPDSGSNPADDHYADVLEDTADDPVLEELTSLIDDLGTDEQIDLVALMWLGRGDYTADDWVEVRAEAAAAHNDKTTEYLLGTPLLADHLAEGLSLLDRSCAEYEEEHL